MNYCINDAWHGGDQPVFFLRIKESCGYCDSDPLVICIVGAGVCHVPPDKPHRFSGQFSSQSSIVYHTTDLEPIFGTFDSVGRCQVMRENKPSMSRKLDTREEDEMLINILVDCCADS